MARHRLVSGFVRHGLEGYMPLIRTGFLCLVVLLGGCEVPPSPDGIVPDPYEARNRRIHESNIRTDRALFRPAAMAYGTILPAPVREGVSNFSENVSTPTYFINDIFQGRGEDAGHNFFRFTLNSTLGVFGIFDPASSFGLERREADFGQTLYTWGVGSGAYIELPLIGPSTQRDAFGVAVDQALNPFRALAPRNINPTVFVSTVGAGLNTRYVLRDTIDQVLYESADSYEQTRETFLQNRSFELDGGQGDDYFDPYEDILE